MLLQKDEDGMGNLSTTQMLELLTELGIDKKVHVPATSSCFAQLTCCGGVLSKM